MDFDRVPRSQDGLEGESDRCATRLRGRCGECESHGMLTERMFQGREDGGQIPIWPPSSHNPVDVALPGARAVRPLGLHQPPANKRAEQPKRQPPGQPALVDGEGGVRHDDRANSGARGCAQGDDLVDCGAMGAEQRNHSAPKPAFLIAPDLGAIHREDALHLRVLAEYAQVKRVQVRDIVVVTADARGPQFRGQHRQHREHHPLRPCPRDEHLFREAASARAS